MKRFSERLHAKGAPIGKNRPSRPDIARKFTECARIYRNAHSESPESINVLDSENLVSDSEKAKLLRFSSLHPFFGEGLRGCDLQAYSASRDRLAELLEQSRNPRVESGFMHVDLLLKRERKSHLAVLVDMLHAKALNMKAFYLASIDSRVSRSHFGEAQAYGRSMIFSDLVGTIERGDPVV